MSETLATLWRDPGYSKYWRAWIVLLLLTVAMVSLANPVILLTGIAVKAAIILFVFMHLKYERAGLVISVLGGIFLTMLVLVLLTAPDGMAM